MKKKFMAMGLTSALATDFAWLVSCATGNAECGYGVRELFRSNATARDLMEISNHKMQRMIGSRSNKDSAIKVLQDAIKAGIQGPVAFKWNVMQYKYKFA